MTSSPHNLEPLNIVIPMAGRGSRFAIAGYELPKPLILVHGRPMIEWVVENLRPNRTHRFIFLCLADHLLQYDVEATLQRIAPNCTIVPVSEVTEGAASTVLLAQEFIDTPAPLMVANSDQWIDVSIDEYLAQGDDPSVAGVIMTMWADDPKWSFVRLDDRGAVVEVVEKEVVSNEATVGIYNFAHGADFVRAAQDMVKKELRVNGEFYVAPTYNQLLAEGLQVEYVNIGAVEDGMFGLGTPSDLDAFLASEASSRDDRP